MTFFRSYDLHMTAIANCAASHEKLSSFVFSHIMFLKNDDVNALCQAVLHRLATCVTYVQAGLGGVSALTVTLIGYCTISDYNKQNPVMMF